MPKGNYEVEVPISLRIRVKDVGATTKKKAVKEAMERIDAAMKTLSTYMVCYNMYRDRNLCTYVDGLVYDD